MTDRRTAPRRPAPITFRLPRHLREEFRARVEASGLSASAYIVQCIFRSAPPRRARRPSVDSEQLAAVLVRAAEMADRLRTIERLAADGGQDVRAPVAQAAIHLAELRSALFKALGRTP